MKYVIAALFFGLATGVCASCFFRFFAISDLTDWTVPVVALLGTISSGCLTYITATNAKAKK